MAGLDLTGIRRVIDSWLIDTVRIQRDSGAADDVLNESTGQLTPGATPVIYEDEGAIQPLSKGDAYRLGADVADWYERAGVRYRLLLPLTAAVIVKPGDQVTCLTVVSTSGDTRLAGRKFEVVDEPPVSSFAVVRFIYLKAV